MTGGGSAGGASCGGVVVLLFSWLTGAAYTRSGDLVGVRLKSKVLETVGVKRGPCSIVVG